MWSGMDKIYTRIIFYL